MGSEDPPTPSSHRKHRRSSPDEDGSEDVSKRRKHHHHRRHHRHRHHHRNHDGERAVEEDVPPVVEAEAVEVSAVPPRPGDDDIEEGEILEGEEEIAYYKTGGSDLKSGKINPEAVDACPDQGTSGEEDTFSNKGTEVLGLNLNRFPDEIERENVLDIASHETSDQLCEISWEKDAKGILGDFTASKMEDLKIVNEKEGSDIPRTVKSALSEEEHEIGTEGEARLSQSASPRRGTEMEKKYRDVGGDDSGSPAISRSPVSGESLHSMKHKKRDDLETRVLERNLERHELRRHLELGNANRNVSDMKNRSISPESFRDKYKDRKLSPSYSRHYDEGHHRDRSRSRDHTRERSYDHGPKSYEDVNVRYNSDRGRDARYDVVDRHTIRSRASDAETDKGAGRERERSSSYSRHDGRGDRHGSLDRDRERERDRSRVGERDREKERGISRERDWERERVRDVNSIREKDRDGSNDRDRGRVRDREMNRDKYRERGRQMERGTVSSRDRHRDSRQPKYDEPEHFNKRTRSKDFASEASSARHNSDKGKEKSIREEEEEEDYQEKIEQQLAKHDEEDLDKIKEESRRRRQAILEKYKQLQSQPHVESPSNDHEKENMASSNEDKLQEPNASNAVCQALHEGLENGHDPSDVYVADPSFNVGKSPLRNGTSAPERTAGTGGLGEGTPKSERSADMFCDDIFGESPAGVRKAGKGDGLQVDRSGLHDNWDDAEGYYSYRFGEVLDGRYEVIAAHGKGVFSTVVRAKDLKAGKGDPEEVAIKIIRNNDTMYKAGLDELIILKKLAGADPEDKRHCVRFISSFKYRNHLCLVFESLHMNLREVLKKFGRNIGLKLTAVRAYAKQLFIALKHLRNCGVLHCDIKPDNMLVNEAKNVLKLCDFGNAMFAGKNEITPYLVSRFYRSPEIVLGLTYDHPLDIWSVGCCLYEIYSGKVLFPGPSNNDMLRLHMELKGPFPKKMLRKGAFTDQHFDQDLNFHATEEDPVTKKTVKRLLLNIRPKDIGALISSSPGEDPKMLANFKDLLERIFILDPEKRMTVSQALSHPFITGK